jgi:hypothetical protein
MWVENVRVPMKGCLSSLLILVLLCFGGYIAWTLAYPTYSYRFRLVLEAEKDGEVKTGSSVFQVKTVQYPSWVTLGANNSETSLTGEAVTLELAPGQDVFGVLIFGDFGRSQFEYLAPLAFFSPNRRNMGRDSHIEWSRRLSHMSGRKELSWDLLPVLITFDQPNDTNTVHRVLPDDFASVFGAGTKFRRGVVELTNDPVTHSIESKLPWLRSRFGRRGDINGRMRSDPAHPESNLYAFDFETGFGRFNWCAIFFTRACAAALNQR